MTKTAFIPRPGLRFAIHGCEFEIAYVGAGMVRYAACIGGKAFRIPFERFMEMQRSDVLLISPTEVERMSADGKNRKLAELNEEERKASIRQMRYVEAAVTRLSKPCSKLQLDAMIPILAEELQDSAAPSSRTVAGWVQNYFAENKSGMSFYPKRYLKGNRTLRFSPQIEILISEGIQQIYLVPERKNAKDVLAYVVGKLAEQGLLTSHDSMIPVPSIRTIERRIKSLDPYVVALVKKGKAAADRLLRAAGRELLSPRAMFIVQIDTHQIDVIIIDPDTGEIIGRPYLVCITDVYTRTIVGTYISMFPPSATTTLAAAKDMLTRLGLGLPGGIPVRIIPDNGVEFKNTAFSRLCAHFNIILLPAEVRDPNDKAHIESFFRTLTYGLIQKLKGTTFSSPVDRGDYDSQKNASVVLEKLHGYILEWINEVYHKTIHTRTGRAPILAWSDATSGWEAPEITPEEINVIARWPVQKKISKGRVLIDKIEYFSHALATLECMGETNVTVLIDELNLHSVYVEHPTEPGTHILAESTNPDYTKDLTWYEHQETKKIIKNMSEADRQKLGRYAPLLAWWTLMEKINKDSAMAKKQIARITNGKGRIEHAKEKKVDVDFVIGSSSVTAIADDYTTAGALPLSSDDLSGEKLSKEDGVNNSDGYDILFLEN
ncbi:DDE-type integrase/transposase/recombinase [Chitinibacter tainanensis]|uniref:DDE-type integrase/transposase/recombinase n=1 Tax=Chitinibacter tainanensis TaxID=230667 RepID=UPI000405E394|nr:DDE-type integrase/transposase/recombinase [Chitinibacter tainanensis]